MHEIADIVEVSISQVSRDMKKISEQWQKSAMEDIQKIKSEDLQELLLVQSTAWREYERSREEKVKKSMKKKTGGIRSGTEQMQTKEQMVGDPKWMDVVLKCIAKREEILGYGAARKLDLTTGGEQLQQRSVIILPSNGREVKKEENNE